ncbi:helix-turn-helix domain-containing protein [bacterium]|nr:helix-turn-helix domain-containing protein [bacterium]
MAEYLSKEEIKQWRSSLEKITLEEFAQRLGKTLKEEKETRDIVDMVMHNQSVVSRVNSTSAKKRIEVIHEAAKKVESKIDEFGLNLTFKKPLTEREKIVLNVFIQNKDSVVYARDLAKTLDLPTDYVYKYIKNLRTKIEQNILENADRGGYKLVLK